MLRVCRRLMLFGLFVADLQLTTWPLDPADPGLYFLNLGQLLLYLFRYIGVPPLPSWAALIANFSRSSSIFRAGGLRFRQAWLLLFDTPRPGTSVRQKTPVPVATRRLSRVTPQVLCKVGHSHFLDFLLQSSLSQTFAQF